MSLPTDYRGTAVTNAKAALEAIQKGDEYRTSARTVTLNPDSIFEIASGMTPAYTVYAEDETDSPGPSNRNLEEIDIVVECKFYADAHEWRDMSITQIIDWIIADMKKAMDTDRTRGISGIFKGRRITVAFEKDQTFGLIFLTDTVEYRRPCP